MSRCRFGLAIALLAIVVPSAGATRPSLAKLVGQTVMTGFHGTRPSAALLDRIQHGEVGGVILFRGNISSEGAARALIAHLQAAAKAGGNPKLLVAVDQEGGPVRRFAEAPPSVSASEIATVTQAKAEGMATGRFLRRIGVSVDLAPVLDTPASPRTFLGSRVFSRDPARNARLGAAFIRSLELNHVAATAKHFPGLGNAGANTDSSHVWIKTSKRSLDARLPPFATAIESGVDLVMVSNAGYRAYDASGLPAVLSHRIVTGLLRGKLGFDGVVISDSMEAPGPSSRADAASTAVRAGTDIVLYLSEHDSARAYDELLSEAKSGKLLVQALWAANQRIEELKGRID